MAVAGFEAAEECEKVEGAAALVLTETNLIAMVEPGMVAFGVDSVLVVAMALQVAGVRLALN